jgi:hypothetical protein
MSYSDPTPEPGAEVTFRGKLFWLGDKMGPGAPNSGRGGANSEYMLEGADPPGRESALGMRGMGGRGPSRSRAENSEFSDFEESCVRKGGSEPGPGWKF